MKAHLYNTLLFLHIMFVVVWVGGGIMLQVVTARVLRSGPEAIGPHAHTLEQSGKIFGLMSGLTFLVGVVMTFMSDLWHEPWIAIAIAGFLASSFIGGALLSKRSKALVAIVDEKGAGDPGVAEAMSGLLKLSRIDLVILTVVVWDMVYKPFSGSI